MAAVRDALPARAHLILIEDGSEADATASTRFRSRRRWPRARPRATSRPRSGDDRYILYTGGTTGLPKGVVWRHEDVFFALGGGIDAASGWKARRPEDMLERADAPGPRCYFSIAPLMHGATQWSVMSRSFVGHKNVLIAKFEPHEVWRLVEQERVQALMITGDAMGRPLVEALGEPAADGAGAREGLSSLFLITSTAAVFSPTVKDDFFRHFPNLLIIDGVGASEVGGNGLLICTKGRTAMLGGGPTFAPAEGTLVLDDELRPLAAGSERVGKIARSGHIPLAYYKDPEKSAQVFFRAPDGRRYSMPGDFARVEADGRITLLGRGSVSINSGGEKIYPEEVEHAIKSHPDAYDAVVIGVPDARWGSRVAAIVQPRAGATLTLEAIQSHCRGRLAGYKLPKQLTLVEAIERSPAGKPDYRWAQRVASG